LVGRRPDAGASSWLGRRRPLDDRAGGEPCLRPGGRRLRPLDEGFAGALAHALVSACQDALRSAEAIAVAAKRLDAVAPKLPAKGAGAALAPLLNDDAVSGSLRAENLPRWGARRLFERLESLGAARRELTGRPAFKLYGL
jgi:hypothetical protein